MLIIHAGPFLGRRPRLDPRYLGRHAQRLVNAWLTSGAMRPLRRSKAVPNTSPLPGDDVRTIYPVPDSEAWLAWAGVVDVHRSPVVADEHDRLYYSGDGAPKYQPKNLREGYAGPPASPVLGDGTPDAEASQCLVLGVPAPIEPLEVGLEPSPQPESTTTLYGVLSAVGSDLATLYELSTVDLGASGRLREVATWKLNLGTEPQDAWGLAWRDGVLWVTAAERRLDAPAVDQLTGGLYAVVDVDTREQRVDRFTVPATFGAMFGAAWNSAGDRLYVLGLGQTSTGRGVHLFSIGVSAENALIENSQLDHGELVGPGHIRLDHAQGLAIIGDTGYVTEHSYGLAASDKGTGTGRRIFEFTVPTVADALALDGSEFDVVSDGEDFANARVQGQPQALFASGDKLYVHLSRGGPCEVDLSTGALTPIAGDSRGNWSQGAAAEFHALAFAFEPAGDALPVEHHVWVHTYVTAYGEEGPPSPPTGVYARALVGGGISAAFQSADIRFVDAPPNGPDAAQERHITHRRVYRSATDADGNTSYRLLQIGSGERPGVIGRFPGSLTVAGDDVQMTFTDAADDQAGRLDAGYFMGGAGLRRLSTLVVDVEAETARLSFVAAAGLAANSDDLVEPQRWVFVLRIAGSAIALRVQAGDNDGNPYDLRWSPELGAAMSAQHDAAADDRATDGQLSVVDDTVWPHGTNWGLATQPAQITDIPVSRTEFSDRAPNTWLAETLVSTLWDPPPAELAGLTLLPNGVFAGYVGSTIHLSEPFFPHAWPQDYAVSVEQPIVAMLASGTTLAVLTEGQPYLLSGTDPASMALRAVPLAQGCRHCRGVAPWLFGVGFPTPDGLALLGPEAARLVTTDLYDRQSWQQELAALGRFATGLVHDDRYLLLDGEAGLVLSEDGATSVRPDTSVSGAWLDLDEDELYVATDSGIRLWEGGEVAQVAEWRSGVARAPRPFNVEAIQVLATEFPPRPVVRHATATLPYRYGAAAARDWYLTSASGPLSATSADNVVVVGDWTDVVAGDHLWVRQNDQLVVLEVDDNVRLTLGTHTIIPIARLVVETVRESGGRTLFTTSSRAPSVIPNFYGFIHAAPVDEALFTDAAGDNPRFHSVDIDLAIPRATVLFNDDDTQNYPAGPHLRASSSRLAVRLTIGDRSWTLRFDPADRAEPYVLGRMPVGLVNAVRAEIAKDPRDRLSQRVALLELSERPDPAWELTAYRGAATEFMLGSLRVDGQVRWADFLWDDEPVGLPANYAGNDFEAGLVWNAGEVQEVRLGDLRDMHW